MDNNQQIQYIDEADISHKKVLLRVDFNVSLISEEQVITIGDDARIREALPTIKYLLDHQNKVIIISHLGRPEGKDKNLSMKIVADHLRELLKDKTVTFVEDFESDEGKKLLSEQQDGQIVLLENIRFWQGETKDDENFAKELASLGDIFVNDGFGVSHREQASVTGIPRFLPSYGGFLMKKEIEMISKSFHDPKKPLVAILGGAKILSKINLLFKLTEISDSVLLGGGIANTFLLALGKSIGKSIGDNSSDVAKNILEHAKQHNCQVVLPTDVIVSDPDHQIAGEVVSVDAVSGDKAIFDIGPETQAEFGNIIASAATIIWNGPVGYFESPLFRRGTDFIYYSIADNNKVISIVGGGDTLAAVSKKEHLDKITHISTGGGAMLEFIEKGTLPGIEALKKSTP